MNFCSSNIRKTQQTLTSHKVRIKTKTLVYAFKILVILVVFAGVGLVSLAAGSFNGIIDTAPEITLNDVTPSQYKTTVYDKNGEQIETLVASGANRIYVTIDEIPVHLQNAFIAIEDERFYQHNGIDAKGIIRAAYIGITNNFRFTQGASTITQQLIKNSVFAVENENSLSDRLKRKIQEQYLAVVLEKEVDNKKIILENYLNTINLGNNNLGVQSASINYFNKDVSELTLSECAVIAAITQNPSYYNPIRHPEYNEQRRKLVLNNMLLQGLINKDEYDEAIADDVYSRIQNVHNATSGSGAYSYYTDALVQDIMEDLMTQKGYTYTQAYNLVYRGGLSIYSCEDSELQKFAEDTVNNPATWNNNVEYSITYRFQIRDEYDKLSTYTESSMLKHMQAKYGSDFSLLFKSVEEADSYCDEYLNYVLNETGGSLVAGSASRSYTLEPQTSMVVIENNTGEVRVLIGGRGDKTQSLILNRATSSQRQAGSSIKPLIVYSPAIDTKGYTLGHVYDDIPFYYDNGQLVKNSDGKYMGYTTLRDAVAESRNIPALLTLKDIGITTGISYLKNYGITTLTDADYYLPIALGTCSVTNYEMTAAYTTFANGGEYITPKLYTKVLDHDGNVILDNTQSESTRVIKETTAWLTSSAMHSVVTSGTLKGIVFPSDMYVCGKSGTSQNDYDKWTIGYSGNYTVGVWAGYDNNKKFPHDVYGYPYMFIWRDMLVEANEANNADCTRPEKPDKIVEVKICKDSGLLAVEGLCDHDQRGKRITTEYFEAGTEPTEACTTHVRISLCSVSGDIANGKCPSKENVVRIYKKLDGIDLDKFKIEDEKYSITDKELDSFCKIHN